MQQFRIPRALLERLGQDATLCLVDLLDGEKTKWSDDLLNVAGDRFERRLTEQVSTLRVELHEGLATLRVELLKWSFLFWLGQIAAIAGLLAFMLRASGK